MNSNLQKIAQALREGRSFGPRTSCVGCNSTLEDFDDQCRALCETCGSAIEAIEAIEAETLKKTAP
jgi:hypothetical protein